MSRRPAPQRLLAVAAVALLGIGALAACGDDKSDTKDTVAPEAIHVPMSEVLTGLPKIVDLGNAAASAAATGDYTTAKAKADSIETGWHAIEGTVKATDADTYEKIETAQGLMRDGASHSNAERVQQGASDQSDAVQAFITASSGSAGSGDTGTSTTAANGGTLPGE